MNWFKEKQILEVLVTVAALATANAALADDGTGGGGDAHVDAPATERSQTTVNSRTVVQLRAVENKPNAGSASAGAEASAEYRSDILESGKLRATWGIGGSVGGLKGQAVGQLGANISARVGDAPFLLQLGAMNANVNPQNWRLSILEGGLMLPTRIGAVEGRTSVTLGLAVHENKNTPASALHDASSLGGILRLRTEQNIKDILVVTAGAEFGGSGNSGFRTFSGGLLGNLGNGYYVGSEAIFDRYYDKYQSQGSDKPLVHTSNAATGKLFVGKAF